MTVACIVQARTGSTRLPGKVLLELAGQTVLGFLLSRVKSLPVEHLVVATSDLAADDAVEEVASSIGVPVVRGSEQDVLSRFHVAIELLGTTHIIRLTADCPLADPQLITAAMQAHWALDADYTSNTLARTYPDGLDVEVIRTTALVEAAHEATDPVEREHVTPFLYRRPARFRLGAFCSGRQLGGERWTIDTADDLERIREIVTRLEDPLHASWLDVLAVAGTTATPLPGSLWLRPECWRGIRHRRSWDVMIDDGVVGHAIVELERPGSGRVSYDGLAHHRRTAMALVREALQGDRQVVDLVGDSPP